MKTIKSKLIITQEDYATLNGYVKGLSSVLAFDKKNAALLKKELDKATLVKRDEIPDDVVRLNSKVVVKEEVKDRSIELILVLPEKADIKEKRISVFAPIGTALIGFRQGEKVTWKVPSGLKTFTIMKVDNRAE